MTFSVCFIDWREAGSPSIDRVFRAVAEELKKHNIQTRFVSVPYSNGFIGTILNLLLFRPPRADIFHVTGRVNYLGLILPQDKTILTIHDLTILDFRSGIRRFLIENLYFVWPSRRLKHLTTISQATKDRLAAAARISPKKIEVIENPLLVSSHLKKEFNNDEPVILQVGTAPYKNVDRLVEALSGLTCRMHIVGKISPSLYRRIQELDILLINDESLDDDGIDRAYQNADIVTLCSTDEGFGLPIIEGQANGALVITSDRSPMKEVAGGGAILVDPENVDSIRNGILGVLANAELRATMVEAGKRNIRRFERSEIARKYMTLYRGVLRKIEREAS